MSTKSLLATLAALSATLLLLPVSAHADQPDVLLLRDDDTDFPIAGLELTLDAGLMDRGTTGIGAPLLGYGYDHGGGLLVGGGIRAYFDIDGRYFHHGVALRIGHQPNDGIAWTQLDLAYVFRTELPCMSNDDRTFRLSGLVGVTGARAEAGTGSGGVDDQWNLRRAAADELDHLALGGLLGVSLDLHAGPFLVGVIVDIRETWALDDGPASRSFVTTGALRAGVEIDP